MAGVNLAKGDFLFLTFFIRFVLPCLPLRFTAFCGASISRRSVGIKLFTADYTLLSFHAPFIIAHRVGLLFIILVILQSLISVIFPHCFDCAVRAIFLQATCHGIRLSAACTVIGAAKLARKAKPLFVIIFDLLLSLPFFSTFRAVPCARAPGKFLSALSAGASTQ